MNKLKETLINQLAGLEQLIKDNDVDFSQNVKEVYECLDGVHNPTIDELVNDKIEVYNNITEENNQMIIKIKDIIAGLE